MRITLTSVLVDDQEKALRFYTEVLGFVKKLDLPLDGGARWLTVASPEEPDGTQIALEPVGIQAARDYQKALHEQGIPLTAFAVDDVWAEHERLKARGVHFRMEPAEMGAVTAAIFDDTCGNLIQIYQA